MRAQVLGCVLIFCACAQRPLPSPGDARETSPGAAAQPPVAPSTAGPSRGTGGQTLTLIAGGDVTLGHHYEKQFETNRAKGIPLDVLFAYGFQGVVKRTSAADLFVVNLECPFTTSTDKLPKNFNFKASPALVQTLSAGGVDAVSLANNHTMDFGVQGMLDTMATLDAAGIPHFGAGKNLAEARRPLIVERNGIKIAFLGYFFLGTRNIEPPEVIATATTPGVAGERSDTHVMIAMLREDIRAAKTRADVVIPFFHWGREAQSEIEPYQGEVGRAAVDAGATLVLGSHPHILQGVEVRGKTPIVYSLGNFVFGGNWNPRNKEAALFEARLSVQGFVDGQMIPILTDSFPEKPFQPFIPEGETAARILQSLKAHSAAFENTLPQLK